MKKGNENEGPKLTDRIALTQGTSSQGALNQNALHQGTSGQGALNPNTLTQEPPDRGALNRSALNQGASTQGALTQNVLTQETLDRGTFNRKATPSTLKNQPFINKGAAAPTMGLQHEKMIIDSKVPISEVLTLNMSHQLGEHGYMSLEVIIDDEEQMKFLQTNYRGQNIKLFQNQEEARPHLVFNGHIETIAYEKQSHFISASIEAASYSTFIDQIPRRRSFQNTSQSFKSLCSAILDEAAASIIWEVGNDVAINTPFVQYDETDFAFLKRLLSHLRQPLQVSILFEDPHCYAGVRRGRSQTINETMIIKMGVSDVYYEKAGYAHDESRLMYEYLQVKHQDLWEIGDFVTYRKQKFTVVQQEAIFEKGELLFIYLLGAAGFLQENIIDANHLIGLSLQGEIRQAEEESITIQLDIDQDEQAHYFWPWTPRINNLGYVMPEVGSRVVLTFSTHDEKDAVATHLFRTNSNSPIYEQVDHKLMRTIHDQMIGLFPDRILLTVKDHTASISLKHQAGIQLETSDDICLNAQGEITLNGHKLTVTAPEQILMQTPQSNIQMAGNFNFFSPSGVGTSSDRSTLPPPKRPTGAASPNLLPLCLAATGALPGSLTQHESEWPTFAAAGALPNVGRGETALAIHEMMNGQKAEETSSPRVFESLASHAMKGGKPIPRK